MNWDRIQSNWKFVVGRAKERWSQLSEDDFVVVAGRRNELIGKIAARYGVASEEAERQLSTWQQLVTESWFMADKPNDRKRR